MDLRGALRNQRTARHLRAQIANLPESSPARQRLEAVADAAEARARRFLRPQKARRGVEP